MSETRVDGQCKCGESVVKILNSEYPTCRTDGARFVYPDRNDNWCIFRCRGCSVVIDETWRPNR